MTPNKGSKESGEKVWRGTGPGRAQPDLHQREQENPGGRSYPVAGCGLVEYPRPAAGPYEELGRKIGALVDTKNRAYGDSFDKAGQFLRIIYPYNIRLEQYEDMLGIIRIFDKIMRIATNNDKDPMAEDPREDLAGYGLLMTRQHQAREGRE